MPSFFIRFRRVDGGANSSPLSASRCTSPSRSPVARRFVFRLLQLYAAKVRSPILFAASKARRTKIPSGLDVPRPGHDKIPEGHVGTGLVAMQSALLSLEHEFA